VGRWGLKLIFRAGARLGYCLVGLLVRVDCLITSTVADDRSISLADDRSISLLLLSTSSSSCPAALADITTKGILHAVFERCEYWRLRDAAGKPAGLMGWWPSRAVTFLENHDTGSTQGHWRFPGHALEQGYAYILTHPGTPTGGCGDKF